MAIKVYILKKAIMKSSVDEYLALKAEAKEKKKLEKQMNPENAIEQKRILSGSVCLDFRYRFAGTGNCGSFI